MVSFRELLGKHKELQLTEHNRVKCTLSGHEMPCLVEAVRSYVEGPKFKALKRLQNLLEENDDVFEVTELNQVFCKVTNRVLAKDAKALERHLNGAKFKRNFEKYKKNINVQQNGSKIPKIKDNEILSSDAESSRESSGDYCDIETKQKTASGEDHDIEMMDTELENCTGGKRKHTPQSDNQKKNAAKKRKK